MPRLAELFSQYWTLHLARERNLRTESARFQRISQLQTASHAIAVNNTGNLTGMDETEKLRHIIEECVTRQLRGFEPGHDRRDVAYEVAHCVLSRIRSIGIKVVPKSPRWPQVDR